MDTFIVSAIIFVTGGFSSIFSFLYLVVIICAAMLFNRRDSLLVAGLCSMEYGLLVFLEYHGLLGPVGIEAGFSATGYSGLFALYKIAVTALACFAVAFLSSILSERERQTKQELTAMEAHLKRVERMALVGEMAAGLAHEIKNPLAALIGAIGLIKDENRLDPTRERLMQIILREADRLSTLVNHFLIFAKPPAGKPQLLELSQNLSELIDLFEKDRVALGRITLEKNLPPEMWIEMDPDHLRQVIWNLLLNAAEAIDGKGRIRVEMQPQGRRFLEVSIEDDGCGMEDAILKHIFDPFYTTKPTGSGLGLSIVHRILESYGFWIRTDSTVDGGSTFRIRMKRSDPPGS
jgi:two-component system sensor histidine kinase PilS (NtrC family)